MIEHSIRILVLVAGLVAANARGDTIDRERIRRDLAPESKAFAVIEGRFEPIVHGRDGNLIVGEYFRQSNYRAALLFTRLFGARFGLGAWVNATWHGVPAAGFNGLALDRKDRPVANVKFGEVRTDQLYLVEELASRYVDKMNRYQRSEAWSEYVLRQVREDHGYDRKDETVSSLRVPDSYERTYRRYIGVTRRMMQFFEIDGDREGWLVLKLSARGLQDQQLESLRLIATHSPVVRGVIVMARNHLHTVTAGNIKTEDLELCESHLDPSDRAFVQP